MIRTKKNKTKKKLNRTSVYGAVPSILHVSFFQASKRSTTLDVYDVFRNCSPYQRAGLRSQRHYYIHQINFPKLPEKEVGGNSFALNSVFTRRSRPPCKSLLRVIRVCCPRRRPRLLQRTVIGKRTAKHAAQHATRSREFKRSRARLAVLTKSGKPRRGQHLPYLEVKTSSGRHERESVRGSTESEV